MREIIQTYRFSIIVLAHLFLIFMAYTLSFASRFEFTFYRSPQYYSLFINNLLPLVFFRMAAYWQTDLFKGIWRYVGLKDFKQIISGSFLGSLLFAVYIYATGVTFFPRSIFIIDFAYNILFLGGVRMLARIYADESERKRVKKEAPLRKRVIIVGAGDAGEMILREMYNNPRMGYKPVGFVDDHRSKINTTIHGLSVMGHTRSLCKLVKEHNVDEVILALPSASGKAMRRIVNTCKRAEVRFRTLPHIGDIFGGKVTLSQIRDVDIEDLLGRDPVNVEMSLIGIELSNKVIMVTGAAGSIGSELVRQIARFNPRKIILFERSENDLYHLELDLKKREFGGTRLVPFVGDVRDRDRVRECMELFSPSYIFHAAAYKHVPMMEGNPTEAVKNNIFGTKVLTDLASEHGVEKFVLISTDKAVRPTNIMGATKRVAELILQLKTSEKSRTHFVAVRFGNVLGSNGSVIPLFKKQIADGGPVTVTSPEITRYFMTIPEAVQLVIQAGAMGRGGEIFVLEMGEPVKIKELAENLIRLSGFTPGKDIDIKYTGLRPGEKLYEELLVAGEGVMKTYHEKIWVIETTDVAKESLNSALKMLEGACRAGNNRDVKTLLKEIVPEYTPSPVRENLIVINNRPGEASTVSN